MKNQKEKEIEEWDVASKTTLTFSNNETKTIDLNYAFHETLFLTLFFEKIKMESETFHQIQLHFHWKPRVGDNESITNVSM